MANVVEVSIACVSSEDFAVVLRSSWWSSAAHPLLAAGLRYFMVKMGCHQAGRQNLVGMLQRRSVGIIPEGIAGLFRGANR